jgi:branched-chain amino acid transport system permease protein
MVVLGGMGHIPGVILGAVVLTLLPEVLRFTAIPLQMALFGKVVMDSEILRQLILGLSMILVMIYRPKGLWPTPEFNRKKDTNPEDQVVVKPIEIV